MGLSCVKLVQNLQFIGMEFPGSHAQFLSDVIVMCIVQVLRCVILQIDVGCVPVQLLCTPKFSGVLSVVNGPGFFFLSCT